MSPYVRKVPTASGAKAVQIIWSKKHGRAEVEHIGSAHHEAELDLLTAVARQRIHAGQEELDWAVRRAMHGIDTHVAKPEKAIAGPAGINGTGSSPSLAAPARSRSTGQQGTNLSQLRSLDAVARVRARGRCL